MPSITHAPASIKVAYQRPYKSRQQRRDAARRNYDEASDHRFLLRVAGGIGLLFVVVLVFVLKGALDTDSAAPAVVEMQTSR